MTDINQNVGKTPVGLDGMSDGLEKILESTSIITQQPQVNSGVASKQEIETVVMDIIAAKKLSPTQENFNKILASVCHLAQEGATSPKYAENRKVEMYGVSLKVGELRNSCKKVGVTVRKLARGLQNEIITVAKRHNIEGNLSKSYKMENPNYNRQDLIWASDFQTFNENPAMPESVKIWLLENYRSRFKPNSKINYRNLDAQED
uniref:Uncharacterized protein n=1 Tax=Pediastrum angulosum TaxID=271408 RepID=A0A2U8GHS5_9CHLO|nr:hypothetical protein [Pediastrum angulosum]